MNKELQKTVYVALRAYLDDISYLSRDIDSLNAFSNGTPYFDNGKQAESYIKAIRDLLGEVGTSVGETRGIPRSILWDHEEVQS